MGGEEPMRGIVHDSNTLEETIRVSIRLRPLNDKESAKNDSSDWECINNNSVVFRSTLPDRSMFPQTYTFDRVFGCDSTTKQVYEEGAKEVALSVVNGINSTIFAYGQTSSGKTYTMNGVTEYSVTDIYDYIEKHQDREFVLKFSAIEIYNEAVRDLLSFESVPLRLLDDPEKGTVVEKLIEETLKDRGHLQELLSFCQVQRKIGETSLNETSSRSHQILRLTIESTARKFQKAGSSSSLTATVNFVDLAGSERASQTMSAGTRLKEGCHINRSLLALGTVIRKLSKGRNGHVPYRDSKLTRILQNSLGGNGRTAIICTMSPARIHVEQSRNTLLFATCAKAVSTNAHVNVVVSDKALVKQLQKELARLEIEMKNFKPLPGKGDSTALLKEKELVIEQMDKEIRELTRQRDLAQYRIENLLYSVGEDMIFKQSENIVQTVPDLVDLDADVDLDLDLHSEDSSLKTFGTFYGQEENSPHKVDPIFCFSDEDNFLLDSSTPELAGPDPYNDWEEIAKRVHANYVDSCKDVQCIELEEPKETLNEDGDLTLARLEDSEGKMVSISGTNQVVFPQRKNTEIITFDKDFTYSGFVPKAAETQKTLNCIVNIYPSERSLSAKETTKSGFQNLKLARSKSCLTVLLTIPPPSSWIEKADMDQRPQIVGSVVNFSGPEEGSWRKRGLSCGNMDSMDSQSVCSHSSEAKTLQIIDEDDDDDDDNTSVVNFSPEKKGKGKARIRKRSGSRLGMIWKKDEPEESTQEFYMEEAQDFELDSEWILEFQDQQREIIELWDACNVPLAHRSYFFILFKGDPSDAVYMEVELRRLFFIREAISRSTDASGRNAITQASSLKALNREREMLARRIKKKFTVKERDELYEKWGIDLKTKQRSIQLTRMLWSRTKDMEHIQESAALVAKLIGFVDSDQVSREMFGLSFSLQSLHQSSFSRRRNLSLPF
ncbi:kinesin-like protein KIN-7G [Cucurbita pepo subsp. pepo]|uniref:kinesin-like protein KIN-7G n=1 Tax=Cucurbita pepo subsp. pepo TaxID=3664 RepID=UPI000C9D59F0|nr:kinesin-like protein KIN-7G [Cucurbita pepo subsp. pepo]XP_023545786.1 kinesin-like protein KIN-7G [Cucurbita pepo subsp. pepo]